MTDWSIELLRTLTDKVDMPMKMEVSSYNLQVEVFFWL
jgi:hypothetical protein